MNPLTKLHKEQMDWRVKKIEEFNNHPALKFANDAIVLQAVRSGTSGYEGEENLSQWLTKTLEEDTSHNLKQIDAIIEWAKDKQNYYDFIASDGIVHIYKEVVTETMNNIISFLEEYKQQIKL